MSTLRAWFRWRRDLWRLRRDASFAYDRWVRARYAYQDIAVVFEKQPGAWGDAGPCGKAQDEMMDRMHEYQELAAREVREDLAAGWRWWRRRRAGRDGS